MQGSQIPEKRLLGISFAIALVWIGLSTFGFLDGLKNLMMDGRFRYRGPLEAPQKIVYVNQDSDTTAYFGQYLFPRDIYAQVADAVLGLGEAKSVFFDFVLSEYSFKSETVSRSQFYKDTSAMESVVRSYPNQVVLAAIYSDNLDQWIRQEGTRWNRLEDFLESTDPQLVRPALNPIPELPMYPVWQPDYRSDGRLVSGWGQVGLINYAVEKSQGSIVRYVPAFVDVENYLPMKWLARQRANWQSLEYEMNGLEGIEIEVRETSDEKTGRRNAFELWDDGFPLMTIDESSGLTFYTASIMSLIGNRPNATLSRTENYIRIYDGTESLYEIPLIDGKLIGVNYFSPWINLNDLEQRRAAARRSGAPLEDIFLADPYNPMVSFLRVVKQYNFYREAELKGDVATMEEIRSWFVEHFKGAIVMAGPTDPILKDVAPTPFEGGNIPLVSVHGNLVKTITSGQYLRYLPDWLDVMLILFLSLAVSFLAITGGSKALLSKALAVVVLGTYLFIAFTAFKEGHWIVPIIGPVGGAVSASLVLIGYQLIIEEKQKSRIRNLFGTYVSPSLVNQMVESGEEPQLGGHVEDITAFFSDIQNFSTFSELLKPEQLVDLMNEYLDGMTEILEEEGGTLDKYIGDAIVGIFGAPVKIPNHAYHACVATQRIQMRQREFCERWTESRKDFPEIIQHMRTRIGLNTGMATVGNMGSKKRFNYTMMGDTVNLAARNESGAKSYGVYTMVAESTQRSAEAVGKDCVFRLLDKIVVKGRSQPIAVYEIVGLKDHLPQRVLDGLELYHSGIEAYFNREFERAESLFSRAEGMEQYQIDGKYVFINPSRLLGERSRWFQKNPPSDDWDGRFVMTSK